MEARNIVKASTDLAERVINGTKPFAEALREATTKLAAKNEEEALAR